MATKQSKETDTNTDIEIEKNWQAILFDCDCHSIDDVILRLQQAIGCTEEQAYLYAQTAEQFGCVTFFTGSKEECLKVAKPLTAIALDVVVESV